jgi:hypothetical protein
LIVAAAAIVRRESFQRLGQAALFRKSLVFLKGSINHV